MRSTKTDDFLFSPFPYLSYRVFIVRYVPYRQFKATCGSFCHDVDFFFIHHVTYNVLFTWPVVSIYGVVGNVVVILFVTESEESKAESRLGRDIAYYICIPGRCEDRRRSRPSSPAISSSMLLVYAQKHFATKASTTTTLLLLPSSEDSL